MAASRQLWVVGVSVSRYARTAAILAVAALAMKTTTARADDNGHDRTLHRRRVLVQVAYGAGATRWPYEVLVTNAVLKKYNTSCEHMVLVEDVSPEYVSLLKSKGIITVQISDVLADMHDAAIEFSSSDVRESVLTKKSWLPKLGLFKAPTMSVGDVMVFLDNDAIPVANIDSLFDYPSAAMPYWAVPDIAPGHSLNSGVMAIFVHQTLYVDMMRALSHVGLTMGDSDQDFVNFWW
jgi:alpha-N-acetylglucosamine transferase